MCLWWDKSCDDDDDDDDINDGFECWSLQMDALFTWYWSYKSTAHTETDIFGKNIHDIDNVTLLFTSLFLTL